MKASLFNYHFIDDDGNLILYNSYLGKNMIVVIKKNKRELVLEWLKNPSHGTDNPLFSKLFELGYFVDDYVDEKKRREDLMINSLCRPELNLTVHTTKACNFRCQYCCLDFQAEPMAEKVQNGIVNYVRKNISKFNSVSISWFGGEPLLEMDVIENISKALIDICNRAKRPYFGFITTNGYLLNDENLKILLKNQVYNFTVTIDGLKETHNKQRFLANGSGTFDTIIDNLLNIKNNYKSRAIRVNIRSNVTRDILPRIEEYYELYNSLFGDDDRFSVFIKPVGDWGGERVKKIKDSLIGENEIALIYKEIAKMKGDLKFYPNTSDLYKGGVSCPAREKYKFTIGVEGIINKCDDPSLDTAIGLLDEFGNMNIDLDKSLQYTSLDTVLDDECDNCFYSCNCFGSFCPKWKVKKGEKACALNHKELENLILLYTKTEESIILG